MITGVTPRPPIARLVGRELVEVGEGSATYTMPASGWILGPKGRVHTGMLVFLADGALTAAAFTALAPYAFCTTAELSMTFLGEPPMGGSLLTARSRVIHADARSALCECFIEDDGGRLCAHGTGRCHIIGPLREPDPDAVLELEPVPEREEPTPDPHLRPAAGEVLDDDVLNHLSGLEVLRAQVDGELDLPPVHHLTGIRPLAAESGRVVFTLPASEWLRNEFGGIFGGAIGFLAKSAVAGAVQTTAPAGTGYTAVDVKVNFLQPVEPDGRDLVATGTVVHGGRRLAIATAEVVHGQGERVAIATGTTTLRPPSRPAGGGTTTRPVDR
jgi:uncharacterized protein (TIGR00369 family)